MYASSYRSARREPRLGRTSAFADEVAEALETVGADPAWIYAFRKTGLLVTEMNERLIPRADLARWQSAVKEYRSGTVRRREAVFDRALEQSFEDYLRYPYILAKFVDEAVNPRTPTSAVVKFQRTYSCTRRSRICATLMASGPARNMEWVCDGSSTRNRSPE